MPEFETGAIRSDDAEGEAYYLISPIAWARLAVVMTQPKLRFIQPELTLNKCLEHIVSYLSGDRAIDHLALSLFYLGEYFDLEHNLSKTLLPSIETILRYDLISPILLQRLAQRYRLGEKKYGAYNVEKGMPIHDLLNHAIRHIVMHIEGREDEPGDDNLGASAWGLCMCMHSEELWPHLNGGHLRGPNCSLTEATLSLLRGRNG